MSNIAITTHNNYAAALDALAGTCTFYTLAEVALGMYKDSTGLASTAEAITRLLPRSTSGDAEQLHAYLTGALTLDGVTLDEVPMHIVRMDEEGTTTPLGYVLYIRGPYELFLAIRPAQRYKATPCDAFVNAVSVIAQGRGVVRVVEATTKQVRRHFDDFDKRVAGGDKACAEWSVVTSTDGVIYGAIGTVYDPAGDPRMYVAYADMSL